VPKANKKQRRKAGKIGEVG